MPVAKMRGLYAITPDIEERDRLLSAVNAALTGGCRLLQYRDKCSDMTEKLQRAKALRKLTLQYSARLIINDDLALCQLVGADGIHCGRDDTHPLLARAILGPDRLVGVSCYNQLALAHNAQTQGADYLAFGAVFPSPTKPQAVRASLPLLEEACQTLTQPICAIGGITLDKAPALIAAGIDLIAVISDLFDAPDICARAAAYQSLFKD